MGGGQEHLENQTLAFHEVLPVELRVSDSTEFDNFT